MAELIVKETSRVMNLSILPDLYRSDALSIRTEGRAMRLVRQKGFCSGSRVPQQVQISAATFRAGEMHRPGRS